MLCGHFRAKSVLGSAIETLRFAKSTDYLPRDIAAVPDLVEASLSPGTISLGENLGERATLTVSLKDHRGADLGELFGRGSQWGKVRARGIFRRGQPVRVKRGLLGQPFAQFETRHYVFDSFSGPTPQGAASLIAKDPLKLADDDRALAPKPNNGFLVAGISAAATGFTLSPSGIGNAEYPASGIGQIGGKEIFQFTRVGDVCTFTERGALGTGAQQHDAEDRVQVVLRYVATDPAVIINDLLVNYAGVAASYIPLPTWLTETSTFLQRLYTRHITEPTGVNKLVSELIEQAGLALWHDDKLNQLRLQVLRGIPVDAFLYTQANILAGSLQASDQPEKQITQCWTYYGVRNPLAPLDQTDNYRSALATVDLEAETLNGSPVIRTILGTWIAAFNRPAAQRVNDLQIGRFVKAPRKFSFDVMRYSGVEEPQPGGGYRVEWWGNQDEAGNVVNAPIQVTRVNPMADRVRAEAEEMLFKQFVADNLDDRVINLDSNINNVVVRTTHDTIYPAPTAQNIIDGVNLTVIVPDGVIVGSASTASAGARHRHVPDHDRDRQHHQRQSDRHQSQRQPHQHEGRDARDRQRHPERRTHPDHRQPDANHPQRQRHGDRDRRHADVLVLHPAAGGRPCAGSRWQRPATRAGAPARPALPAGPRSIRAMRSISRPPAGKPGAAAVAVVVTTTAVVVVALASFQVQRARRAVRRAPPKPAERPDQAPELAVDRVSRARTAPRG